MPQQEEEELQGTGKELNFFGHAPGKLCRQASEDRRRRMHLIEMISGSHIHSLPPVRLDSNPSQVAANWFASLVSSRLVSAQIDDKNFLRNSTKLYPKMLLNVATLGLNSAFEMLKPIISYGCAGACRAWQLRPSLPHSVAPLSSSYVGACCQASR